ncbi:L,D-transpeptidase [Actinomadura algeriensis]|uniref:Lipoprotein-anchoring transpeptidase ErfK/SrfK n=1 Tax=Actinomadura algeriensis TaxID=1679523 RepID=A0ABR9JXC5_9ACTN|nr:Ig-like domain-containing protein [Actinomadura algeriensis]MBE1535138.1 lipoprotein-anchoring transpeptidase ErfK/SrfK [Actinomadura algeriensis]
MRFRCSGPRDRGRRAVALLVGVGAAAAAGCTAQDEPRAAAVELTVSPRQGGTVAPDVPIAVQARSGTIADVSVSSGGAAVAGSLNEDRTAWRSRWALTPGQTYTVSATALGEDGRSRTVRSRFATAKAEQTNPMTLEAPADGETVGVGIPIVMNFEEPVKDKAEVEKALVVRSNKPVEGAWHWVDEQQVVFRPKKYWPAHTKVSFQAHLAGVSTSKGVYGGKNQNIDFTVGDSQISTADEDSHKMVVKVNGKKVRTIPTSMGDGSERRFTTTNGVHLAMQKDDPVTMTSSWMGIAPGSAGGYSLTVDDSVRISDSGEYVHSAPWSVGSQGSSNVSHGCINVSPSNAEWFYEMTNRGDPIIVTGTDRELEPYNGWSYWQMDWKKWVQGSALKRSVKTGPNADPATLSAQADGGTGQEKPAGS